jgi:thymidine kinase
MESSFLEITLGPMFSGKTTHLVELYNKYKNSRIKVLAINYSADKRYHDSMLSTHDKKMIPCIFTDTLSEVLPNILQANAILINEGQFFPDLFHIVTNLIDRYPIRIHICGLDGDFKRNKFGNILDLIPICDSVVKLHSECKNCQGHAIFSHRLSLEKEQVIIGSSNYIPLCRYCYNKINNDS